MPFSFGQRFDQGARSSLPAVSALLCLLLDAVVWPVPYIGALSPSLALMAIYYWAIHRPDLFRPTIVFVFGLCNDALHALPMGLSSFLFVATYQIVLSQRRYFSGQVFAMLWFGFAIVALLNMLAAWILVGLYNGSPVSIAAPFAQMVFSIVVFPVPAYALIRIQRAFLPVR